jgi:hypothetical protein
MMSVNEFLPKENVSEQIPEIVTKKKRKRIDVAENETEMLEIKKKAKFHCKCPEQWTTVNKMSKVRIVQWVAEKEFEKQAELYSTVTDFAHEMFAMVFDKMSKGDGYVENELKSDQSLKECIRNELGNVVSYLTNRWKLGALTLIDVTNAKRRQMIEMPTIEIIEEINGDVDIEDNENSQAGPMFMEQPNVDENRPTDNGATDTIAGEEEKENVSEI